MDIIKPAHGIYDHIERRCQLFCLRNFLVSADSVIVWNLDSRDRFVKAQSKASDFQYQLNTATLKRFLFY